MNNIKNIERIERYLNKEMTPGESTLFTQELRDSPQLQKDLREYKCLVKGLKHRSWKQKAKQAYGSYKLLKTLKYVGLSITVIALATLSYLAINQEKHLTEPILVNIPLATTEQDTSWHLPNEVFSIETNQESIIETQNGTVIAIPENAFVNQDNSPVTGVVDFEITEAFDPLDVMKAGLSTTSDGELLETSGMFNIEASQKGKQLKINPEKPLLFDVPTETVNPNMMVFDGEYTEDGTINWINPKKMDSYLTTVDIFTLDFYPPRFEEKLNQLGYGDSPKRVTDSIFYSFYCKEASEQATEEEPVIAPLEASNMLFHSFAPDSHTVDTSDCITLSCGIEPSQIKTIWSSKYQNTLLATKEFEERLAVLYQTCNANLLQLYISNLDKNLYEIDKMVAQQLSGTLKQQFIAFSKREDGKVKIDSPTLKALNRYYKKKSRANDLATKKTYKAYWGKQAKLDTYTAKKKAIKSKEDKKIIYDNFKKELDINTRSVYKKLGLPYTKIRVRRNGYQFPVTTVGPKNIDAFISNQTTKRTTGFITRNGKTATLTYRKLDLKINQEDQYDFVKVYLTSNKIPSYRKVKKKDTEYYSEKLNDLISYNLVVIAYTGKKGFIYSQKNIKGDQKITINLLEKSGKDLRKEVLDNSKRIEFKDIKKDVLFNKFLIRDQYRKKKNQDSRKFEYQLRTVIFPCVAIEE